MEFAADYGNDEIEKYCEGILDYADKRMSEEIRAMPDGDYDGVSWLDSNGKGGTNIQIGARVSIRGDKIHIDFSNSAPQNPSGNNSSYGVMQAAAGIPILCSIDPTIPHNDGCLRHITADAPIGSVCNAAYPASTSLATVGPGDTMQEAVWKALAHAVPDRVLGGNGKDGNLPMLSGTDSRGEAEIEWGCLFFNGGPAGGATSKVDGWPLIMTSAGMGGLKILSVELCELLYPLRIDRQEIATDSMGHGKHHGGPGVEIQITPTSGAMHCELFGEGQSNPPFGVMNGTPGIGGGSYKENIQSGKRTYCSSKGRLVIEEGEIWAGTSSGGGGYGNPLERNPAAVLASYINGFLSLKCAKEVYGVVIDAKSVSIIIEKTKALRKKLKSAGNSNEITTPNGPGYATWVQNNLRPGDEYLIDPQ